MVSKMATLDDFIRETDVNTPSGEKRRFEGVGLQKESIYQMVESILVENPHGLAGWMKIRASYKENRGLTLEEFDEFSQCMEKAYVWEQAGRPDDELVVDLRNI